MPSVFSKYKNLPIEVRNRVWEFLPMNDLVCYSRTSGSNRIQVQDFIRRNTNDEIRRFVRDPNALQLLLWENRAIISGSVALAALISFELRDWQPGDMDIYTTPSKVDKFLTQLVGVEGYTIVSRSKTDDQYITPSGIMEVIKLVNTQGAHTDLILSENKCSFTQTLNFYGSHVSNGITGRGIVCLYPQTTLNYRVLMNLPALYPNSLSIPLSVQRCMVKYTKRGFKFEINPLAYLRNPHDCIRSPQCPHTGRNLYDRSVMAIAFHRGCNDKEFVPNSMHRVFRGLFYNSWCIGGDACNLDDFDAASLGHYLLEVKLHSV
jgi:hypothetical protein